jgi:hypothetical protein
MDTIDSPKTALIVGDNDQAVLQSVSSLLGKIGFVVLRASGGSARWTVAAEEGKRWTWQ